MVKKQHNILQNVVNHKVVCGNFHDLIDISCSPNPAAAFAPYNNYVLLGSLKEGHSHLIFTTLFPPQVWSRSRAQLAYCQRPTINCEKRPVVRFFSDLLMCCTVVIVLDICSYKRNIDILHTGFIFGKFRPKIMSERNLKNNGNSPNRHMNYFAQN